MSISDLEKAFNNGSLHFNHSDLRINQSDSPELTAAKLYFSGKLAKTTDKTFQFFSQASTNYPNTDYGQLALLEGVKIDFFNRNYDQALVSLQKIKDCPEKDYWKIRSYYFKNRLNEMMESANTLFKRYPQSEYVPEIYCLILETYQNANKMSEFNIVKENFKYHKNYLDFEPFVLYNEGLLMEKQQLYSKALLSFNQLVEKYPSSQYRVNADDKIIIINKIVQQNKPELSETPQTIAQPQVPKGNQNKPVTCEKLEKGQAYLQYGVFALLKSAETYKKSLESQGITPFVIEKMINDKAHFAVIQGPFKDKTEAMEFLQKTKANNINSFLFIP